MRDCHRVLCHGELFDRSSRKDRPCHGEPVEPFYDHDNYCTMNSYFVYIVQCSDGSYYTGVTNNVERRLYEHQEGLIDGCYTHNKRPVRLMFVQEFADVVEAISREKQIKGWTRRKKEALFAGDFEKLAELAKGHP